MAGSIGRADHPVPLDWDSKIIRLRGCPDCDGRGWFLINPFATGGGNGCGGITNTCQCQTCFAAKEYWDKNGELPPELIERMTPVKEGSN